MGSIDCERSNPYTWNSIDNEPESERANFQQELHQIMVKLERMLLAKNIAYGNSALDPIRIFSKAPPTEQLLVRIDDKLSRIVRGTDDLKENDLDDLIGYLILLKISEVKDAAS